MTDVFELAISLTESGFLFSTIHFIVFAASLAVPIVLIVVIVVKRIKEGLVLKEHRLEKTRLQEERDRAYEESKRKGDEA